jgi:hypothetical protein
MTPEEHYQRVRRKAVLDECVAALLTLVGIGLIGGAIGLILLEAFTRK